MEDNYVECISVGRYPTLLEVGKRYHVEESFNLESEKDYRDKEATKRILAKYPNPFFYLKEFHEVCPCCGERVWFWHGLFSVQKQEVNVGE